MTSSDRDTLRSWLLERDPERLAGLFARADALRRETVGDEIHLRGLIEISNVCRRSCAYCGLRRPNRRVRRYRMGDEEILEAAADAVGAGCRTIVLQSGEDPGLDPRRIASLVSTLKRELGIAVTLSLGEQPPEVLRVWHEAGADRYLLKLETGDQRLFARLHPGESDLAWSRRLWLLGVLKGLGYQVGSGLLVGLPGQTADSLARDLQLCARLGLDMVACGPFVCHPDTPLAGEPTAGTEAGLLGEAVTGLVLVALTRLLCPYVHIPATTALRMMLGDDALRPLWCGANVLMPDFTPAVYTAHYSIYPGKERMAADARAGLSRIRVELERRGRPIAQAEGHSLVAGLDHPHPAFIRSATN